MVVERYPSEVLRKHCILVPDPVSAGPLAREMIETMRTAGGIGLAAPQVGLAMRFFVTAVAHDHPRVFINPELVDRSTATSRYEESCLSLPDVYAHVTRPRRVTVRAFDENGHAFELDAKGLLARVIQHEIDHLNGVLFVDHLHPKRRERVFRSFEAATAS